MSDDLTPQFEQLVTRRLGATGLARARRLSGGASQETYRLVAEMPGRGEVPFALRRAPGGVAAERAPGKPGLAAEAEIFRVARAAGIPEPEILWVLQDDDDLGVGFVMEWLEGETLGPRIVRSPDFEQVRPRLARQCGEILGRIHAIDLEESGLRELLDPMTPSQFVEQTYGNYLKLDTPQPMIDYAARWLRHNLPEDHRRTLVHNDFRNGNLMIDPASGVRAVLDWEIAHIGDPVRDLGWMCVNSWRFGNAEKLVGGFGDLDDLLAGYRDSSGIEVDPAHVHFWIVFGSFWWAIGCLGMAAHYRSGPDRSVERAAIGRRSTECQVDLVHLLIPGAVDLVGDPFALDELERPVPRAEMPRAEELLEAVNSFLRGEALAATSGREQFLTRVSANALDIVRRDLLLGPEHRRREQMRLRALLGAQDRNLDLDALRWQLTRQLRDGHFALDDTALAEHLRQTVANQVAIDQPKYSGLRVARADGE